MIAFGLGLNAQAGFVSSKCVQSLDELLRSLESTYRCRTPAKNQIPVECQSFQVKELSTSRIEQIARWLRKYGKPYSLDQKISVAFGDLISVCQSKEPERMDPDAEETAMLERLLKKLTPLKVEVRYTREDYEVECNLGEDKMCALLGAYDYSHGNKPEAIRRWKALCHQKRELLSCLNLGLDQFREKRLHESLKAFEQACRIDSDRYCGLPKALRNSKIYQAADKK